MLTSIRSIPVLYVALPEIRLPEELIVSADNGEIRVSSVRAPSLAPEQIDQIGEYLRASGKPYHVLNFGEVRLERHAVTRLLTNLQRNRKYGVNIECCGTHFKNRTIEQAIETLRGNHPGIDKHAI